MAFLDGETDAKGNIKLFDKKGNRAKRDIVQFVPFRKYKDDYKQFGNLLVEEVGD